MNWLIRIAEYEIDQSLVLQLFSFVYKGIFYAEMHLFFKSMKSIFLDILEFLSGHFIISVK
jgi:hypothetical protein